MSTLNRKWSLVAFEYVMQWLLWTVILPNKHLTPSSVCKDWRQTQPWWEGEMYASLQRGTEGEGCRKVMTMKQDMQQTPSFLHQIYLGPRLFSVHIHHLVSELLLCYFWNWTHILVKVLLYTSITLSPLVIFTYVATNCVIHCCYVLTSDPGQACLGHHAT